MHVTFHDCAQAKGYFDHQWDYTEPIRVNKDDIQTVESLFKWRWICLRIQICIPLLCKQNESSCIHLHQSLGLKSMAVYFFLSKNMIDKQHLRQQTIHIGFIYLIQQNDRIIAYILWLNVLRWRRYILLSTRMPRTVNQPHTFSKHFTHFTCTTRR